MWTGMRRSVSLRRLFVRLEVLHVLVILFARIGHDSIGILASSERPGYRPGFGKENRVVIRDRVLQVIVIHFLDSLGQMQFTAVLMSGSVEPAALIYPNRVDDERIGFPVSDG